MPAVSVLHHVNNESNFGGRGCKLHKGHSQVCVLPFDLIIVSLQRLSVTKITGPGDMIGAQGWMLRTVNVNLLRLSVALHVSPLSKSTKGESRSHKRVADVAQYRSASNNMLLVTLRTIFTVSETGTRAPDGDNL